MDGAFNGFGIPQDLKTEDSTIKNDPYLFNVNLLESLDIDTEEEFMQVEKIYSSMRK